jgi:hypothetical protein
VEAVWRGDVNHVDPWRGDQAPEVVVAVNLGDPPPRRGGIEVVRWRLPPSAPAGKQDAVGPDDSDDD